jgi:hypothetical protein
VHLSAAWIAPLIAGGVGAAALAAAAGAVRRQVAALQQAMRPLRVRAGRRPRR